MAAYNSNLATRHILDRVSNFKIGETCSYAISDILKILSKFT
jgi:hypothetical protein